MQYGGWYQDRGGMRQRVQSQQLPALLGLDILREGRRASGRSETLTEFADRSELVRDTNFLRNSPQRCRSHGDPESPS